MPAKHLLILGAGPGGYVAAFLAADQGMQVTLVDSEPQPGGVCLHRGCIPSKALLHIARLINETREAKEWGLDFGSPQIDLEKLKAWKREVVDKMSGGLMKLSKQRQVKWVQGHGVFRDSNTLTVSGKDDIHFDHCILAVGSRPVVPERFSGLGTSLMDSTFALELDGVPSQLLVVGGGYIGLEMGTVYAALGSEVTVVEMTPGLLPGIDRDLVRILQARLRKTFSAILLGTEVAAIKKTAVGASATLRSAAGDTESVYERILLSVGRQPNCVGIGLENTRVEIDAGGFVQVDALQRTADASIGAIGDVVGGAMLAHKASAEAHVAVDAIIKGTVKGGQRIIPAVVFTDPEIAWCGLTETEAKEQGQDVILSKFPWAASGRAQTLGRPDGVTKLILDPASDQILGVGIVGTGAGELIAEAVLAIEMKATAKDLAAAVHPHPTLSETLKEAAQAHLGQSAHMINRK